MLELVFILVGRVGGKPELCILLALKKLLLLFVGKRSAFGTLCLFEQISVFILVLSVCGNGEINH